MRFSVEWRFTSHWKHFQMTVNCYHLMYRNARFQSRGTTSDFGTKFCQNYMNDKNFEKLNIKIVISI